MLILKNSILLLLLSTVCLAQNTTEIEMKLDIRDVYVLNVQIEKQIGSIKCKCCWNKENNKTYNIFKVQITEVLHQSDTTIYSNSEIMNTRYILIPEYIKSNNNICASFYNSDSKNYLILNRKINIDHTKKYKYKQHAYLTGFLNCKLEKKVNKLLNKNNQN